jgi:diaminopimelate epimerase
MKISSFNNNVIFIAIIIIIIISSSQHCCYQVIFVESFTAMIPPFPIVGPLVEKHVMFPERVNAEFVEV